MRPRRAVGIAGYGAYVPRLRVRTADISSTWRARAPPPPPVEMVTRRLQERGPQGQGYLVYGYKFRPVLIPKAEQIAAHRRAS
jgi:hypothetical protein